MKILALDPATQCGWAHSSGPFGTWDLSIRRDESAGMRLIRLRGKLRELHAADPVELLVYEAARHSAPKMQGALVVQAMLQSVIVTFCEDLKLSYRGYSPSEIKKWATGKGNASKAMMLEAAAKRWPWKMDDNAADALFLLSLATHEYVAGVDTEGEAHAL